MTHLIPEFIACFIAVAAVVMNLRDSKTASYRAPNRLESMMLILIALASSFALIGKHTDFKDKELRLILAQAEVETALNTLTDPIKTLYRDNSGGGYYGALSYSDLLMPKHTERMQRMCALAEPKNLTLLTGPQTWGDIFSASITNGFARLDSAILVYGEELPADLIKTIYEIRNSEFRRFRNLPRNHFDELAASTEREPKCIGYPLDDRFVTYITSLKRLDHQARNLLN